MSVCAFLNIGNIEAASESRKGLEDYALLIVMFCVKTALLEKDMCLLKGLQCWIYLMDFAVVFCYCVRIMRFKKYSS